MSPLHWLTPVVGYRLPCVILKKLLPLVSEILDEGDIWGQGGQGRVDGRRQGPEHGGRAPAYNEDDIVWVRFIFLRFERYVPRKQAGSLNESQCLHVKNTCITKIGICQSEDVVCTRQTLRGCCRPFSPFFCVPFFFGFAQRYQDRPRNAMSI